MADRQYRPRLSGTSGAYAPTVELLYKMVRVDPDSGCHVWTGSPNHNGYGRIGINYRDYLAHRVSYELQIGTIPDGLFVCHKCDNRLCINPEHLFAGTLQDNHADMCSKKRHQFGERQWRAKLTDDDVRAIRSLNKPLGEIAELFGISRSAVSLIRIRKSWKHVA